MAEFKKLREHFAVHRASNFHRPIFAMSGIRCTDANSPAYKRRTGSRKEESIAGQIDRSASEGGIFGLQFCVPSARRITIFNVTSDKGQTPSRHPTTKISASSQSEQLTVAGTALTDRDLPRPLLWWSSREDREQYLPFVGQCINICCVCR